jgi:hypothetical protein
MSYDANFVCPAQAGNTLAYKVLASNGQAWNGAALASIASQNYSTAGVQAVTDDVDSAPLSSGVFGVNLPASLRTRPDLYTFVFGAAGGGGGDFVGGYVGQVQLQWTGAAAYAPSGDAYADTHANGVKLLPAQKVDVDTIKTKAVTVNIDGTTFPAAVANDSTVAKAATALTNATWTDTRAGYLDDAAAILDLVKIGGAGDLTALADAVELIPTSSKSLEETL